MKEKSVAHVKPVRVMTESDSKLINRGRAIPSVYLTACNHTYETKCITEAINIVNFAITSIENNHSLYNINKSESYFMHLNG